MKLSLKDDPIHQFFWVAPFAVDIDPNNPISNKKYLANGVSINFINGKPAVINGLRKFKNPPSWIVVPLVLSVNKIPLFWKDLITLIIYFISLFVRFILQLSLDVNFLLSLFISLLILYYVALFANIAATFGANDISFCNSSFLAKIITCGRAAINLPSIPSDCIIWDNWVFENFILADEPFVKALRIFETCISINNNLCAKLVATLDFQSNLMKDLKLIKFHFSMHILIVMN